MACLFFFSCWQNPPVLLLGVQDSDIWAITLWISLAMPHDMTALVSCEPVLSESGFLLLVFFVFVDLIKILGVVNVQ